MKKVIIGFVVAVFLAATVGANAQNDKKSALPKDKVGLGVKVNDINMGVSFGYALKENFHIGSGIAIGYQSGTDTPGDDGGTLLLVNPFFRFLFENQGNLFPYTEFNFAFTETLFTPSTSTANVEVGGMWFPFPSVSIRGGVNVVNFNIDNSRIGFGINSSFIGIDWWM
jgi:hypothetical protein